MSAPPTHQGADNSPDGDKPSGRRVSLSPRPDRANRPPPRPHRTQRERRSASRSAILAAARAEFIERGYPHVSLEDIVSRAGLTRGALYHQFEDKSCVLEAVVQEEAAAMQARLTTNLAGVDHPLDRIRDGFSLYLDSLEDPRILRLIHVDYPAHCGPSRSTLASPWLAYVEGLIDDGRKRGLIRPAGTRALARLILASSREALIAIAYAEDPQATREEMTAALVALMDGLKAQPDTK